MKASAIFLTLSFLLLNIAHDACAKLSSEDEVLTTFIDENHVTAM